MWSIVGVAIGWLIKNFTFEIAKYVAMRAMIIAIALTIGPWIIFKGLSSLMQYLMNYASTYIGQQGLQPVMIQLIGIAAYLGAKLKIAEGVAIYLSFLGVSLFLEQ